MISLTHFVKTTFTDLSLPKRWMLRGAFALLVLGGGSAALGAAGVLESGENAWSWTGLQSGIGYIGGFLVGALVRMFLKLSVLILGLVAALGFGLSKLGIVEGAQLSEFAGALGEAAQRQASDLQRFLSGFLPASMASGLGVASGITQKPDLTPDE